MKTKDMIRFDNLWYSLCYDVGRYCLMHKKVVITHYMGPKKTSKGRVFNHTVDLKVYRDGVKITSGRSLCAVDDKFDVWKGKMIALKRAIRKLKKGKIQPLVIEPA